MYDICAVLSTVNNYMDTSCFEPAYSWDFVEFRRRAYQRWAICEVCNRIINNPFDAPSDIAEDFVIEMSMYACHSEQEPCRFIFQTALETAESLLPLLKPYC